MNTEKIMGRYYDTRYRDIESGFTIFRFRPQLTANLSGKLKNGVMTCKGVLPKINTEIPIELSGTWESNSYGWTFQMMDYIEKSWDEMVTIDFLRSIKGIGDREAKAILREFNDFFTDIKMPGAVVRIAMVSGVTAEKAETIVDLINSQAEKRELMRFVFDHGGKMKNVDKLFFNFGTEGLDKLKEDPYRIGDKIGLSLESCDSIARSMQKDMNSPERLYAYAQKFLEKEMMSGNIYVKERELTPAVIEQLTSGKNNISTLDFVKTLQMSDMLEFVREDDSDLIYLKYLKKAENKLAENIIRLQSSSIATDLKDEYIDHAESIAGFKFAPEQRNAFRLLKKTGIGILTGGPGTGKTATVKGIIEAYEKMYPDKKIKLCAPTGRAAQRMTESTGRPSTTIHRLLEYRPFEGDTDEIMCKNEFDPIDADLIVVDEVSMLDCVLASLFFAAIKSGTLVIMVGDINQLQSVGAGDVLNDLIKSDIIPVERLIRTYRQAAGSMIIKNANEINIGHEVLCTGDDFEIRQTKNVSECVIDIVKQYHKRDDLFYAQVLSPAHKGDGGVLDINKKLQEELNPGDVPFLVYGRGGKFKLYDKIIMTRNNVEKGYYNGDVGHITKVSEDSLVVKIQDQEIKIDHSNLDDIKLAYSMTIHKSQGSEFPVVIIALPNSGMLKRNLLYTAVTRAKEKVIIVQQSGAIAIAVRKNDVGKRNTTLVKTLKKLADKIGL